MTLSSSKIIAKYSNPHKLVDQRDRPVLHLRRRIALRVDVADLFQLQSAFESNRKVHTPSQEQEVVRQPHLAGEPVDGIPARLDHAFHRLRQIQALVGESLKLGFGQSSALSAEVEREEKEREDLASKGLSGGDTDLGTGVDVPVVVEVDIVNTKKAFDFVDERHLWERHGAHERRYLIGYELTIVLNGHGQ